VLTDLAEAYIAPPGRLNADAVIYVKASPGSGESDMTYQVLEANPRAIWSLKVLVPSFADRPNTRSPRRATPAARVTASSRLNAVGLWARIGVGLRRRHYGAQLAANLSIRTLAMLGLAERTACEQA
jgi:hypothetical protein